MLGRKVSDTEYTDEDKKTAKVCKEWVYDNRMAKIYTGSISVMINAVNFVMRFILIRLISNIGEDVKSAQTSSIKVGIFITQFFNTAILLLLVNANFSETNIPIVNDYMKG